MKQIGITFGLLLAVMAFIGYSCKKSSNNNPFGTAKIATAMVSNNGAVENYLFIYDASNNIDSVFISGSGSAAGLASYLKYNYIGSSWSITSPAGSFMVYGNTAGQLLKVLIADTLTYSYTNNQLSEINQYAVTLSPPYYVNTPTYYTWFNGDVTKAVTGSQTQTYTYNTGKNGQPGDPIRIAGFLAYGVSPVKTTHLPESISNSSTQGVNYFYTFDSKGRIDTLTEVAFNKTLSTTDTTTYVYTYY